MVAIRKEPFHYDTQWDVDHVQENNVDRIIALANADRARFDRRQQNVQHIRRLTEAKRLYRDAQTSRRAMNTLMEAMSTSDFPLLMGDILQRQLMDQYHIAASRWQNYCKPVTVNDFREMRLIATDGARGRFQLFKNKEETDLQEQNDFVETGYTLSVDRYRKSIALDWTMLINDDLGGFNSLPNDLSIGAHRTEDYMVVSLYVTSGGPDSTFFSDAHKNKITTTNGASADNPVFGTSGIMDAFTVLALQTDANGEPIDISGGVTIVVPPGIKNAANMIKAAQQIWANDRGGSTDERLIAANWIADEITVVSEPYAQQINSTNGGTAWYVFANPNQNRPALGLGFLRGYQDPLMLMKAPNTVRVGGGAVDPLFGDFDTQEIRYAGMHILGSTTLDPKMAVASTGAGS